MNCGPDLQKEFRTSVILMRWFVLWPKCSPHSLQKEKEHQRMSEARLKSASDMYSICISLYSIVSCKEGEARAK